VSDWIARNRVLAAVIAVVAAFVCFIALSPPGNQDTIEQEDPIGPPPAPSLTEIERLQADWDSLSYPDWPAADVLGKICSESYSPPINAKVSFQKHGFVDIETFVDASNIGYVISAGDTCVIVFRGTDDAGDWLVNLNSISTNTPHGPIHRGFFQGYAALQPQILKALETKENLEHLWITGHSLGGALALVCAYDLEENHNYEIDGIITFGQPMVARSQLASHLDDHFFQRYAHFVNDNDIVPRVPPGHSYCGSMVWFTQNGLRRSTPREAMVGADKDAPPIEAAKPRPLSEREFRKLKADLRDEDSKPKRNRKGEVVVEGNSPWIRDHSMELYLEKLRAIARPRK